jgi:beta-galactosidase/beta-glucuronidase
VPARLDVADKLGILILDENHFYGEHGRPYGVYNPETRAKSQRDLAELVQRDRNHPSVWVWNFCVSADHPSTLSDLHFQLSPPSGPPN